MSTHNYTRKNAGGGFANPDMGDPNLPALVATGLPGKTFVIRANGASLNIVFDATLTSPEVTTLDAQYAAWSPVVPTPPPTAAPQPNYIATAPPTATDDEDAGYTVGSPWVDTTNDKAYICLDPTADAAVWKDTTTVAGVLATWLGPWVTSTAYAVDDAVENGGASYICILAHTAGATDEPGVGASWETYWDLVAAAGQATTPVAVSDTDVANTTSANYPLLPGMTTTPPAGTYKFSFSSSGEVDDKAQIGWIAIFQNGSIVQRSERRLQSQGNSNISMASPLHTQAVLTVSGSEAVEVRYKSDGSHTFTVYDRSLIRGS
jgi:hypothetical protein